MTLFRYFALTLAVVLTLTVIAASHDCKCTEVLCDKEDRNYQCTDKTYLECRNKKCTAKTCESGTYYDLKTRDCQPDSGEKFIRRKRRT